MQTFSKFATDSSVFPVTVSYKAYRNKCNLNVNLIYREIYVYFQSI